MKQTSDGGFFFVTVIAGVLVVLIVIILIVRHSRKQEKERYAEIAAIEAEKRKAEEAERKAKLDEKAKALQAVDQYRQEYKLYMVDKETPWTASFIDQSEHNSRLERAYNQRNDIKLVAYDPRYHVGKIRGASYEYYLTSAAFCTCEDFRRRKSPCKHMFVLAHNMVAMGEDTFIEEDYEKGLHGIVGFLFGRFRDKNAAMMNLRERGMISFENQTADTKVAIAGKTTAVKKIEQLTSAGIPIFTYADALQLFTSEIRHPDVLEET